MEGTTTSTGRPRLLMAILAHEDERALEELVVNTLTFCPTARLVLYNSGDDLALGTRLTGPRLALFPSPVRLEYSRVTRFFLDVFDWAVATGQEFDFLVNLETDMLFIREGFGKFLARVMDGHEYMTAHFTRHTPKTSRWRPIRSLRPELPRWYDLFGFEHTHRGFSPGQVFSRCYVETLVAHPCYEGLKKLTARNGSNSLQEVLFPTLTEVLGVLGRSYPEALKPVNRYRPYQAVTGVRRALAIDDAYFVHPVRRNPDDPARRTILNLTAAANGEHRRRALRC